MSPTNFPLGSINKDRRLILHSHIQLESLVVNVVFARNLRDLSDRNRDAPSKPPTKPPLFPPPPPKPFSAPPAPFGYVGGQNITEIPYCGPPPEASFNLCACIITSVNRPPISFVPSPLRPERNPPSPQTPPPTPRHLPTFPPLPLPPLLSPSPPPPPPTSFLP